MILLSFDEVTFLMTLLSCDANILGTHIYLPSCDANISGTHIYFCKKHYKQNNNYASYNIASNNNLR